MSVPQWQEGTGGSRAASLADDLAKRFPEDTIVQYVYLPTIRAEFLLGKNGLALPETNVDAQEFSTYVEYAPVPWFSAFLETPNATRQ